MGNNEQLSVSSLVRHFRRRSQNMTYLKTSMQSLKHLHTILFQVISIWTVLQTITDKESPSFLVALPTMKTGLNVMTLDQSPKMTIQTPGPITVNGSSAIDFTMLGFQLLRSFNCPKHLSPCFCFTAQLKARPEELKPQCCDQTLF